MGKESYGFLLRGLPFFGIIIAGYLGLSQFATIRYRFRKREEPVSDLAKEGVKVRPPQTLEEIYEEYQKEDLDSWSNVRGPRHFEENAEYDALKQQRQALAKSKLHSESIVQQD